MHDEEVAEIDENSCSNTINANQLREYKDFSRPPLNPEAYEKASQDVFLMGIDVTSTIRTHTDHNSNDSLIETNALSDPKSRFTQSTKRATRFWCMSDNLRHISTCPSPETS